MKKYYNTRQVYRDMDNGTLSREEGEKILGEMEAVSKQLTHRMHKFEHNMQKFEHKMEKFGKSLEKGGKNMSKGMSHFVKDMEKKLP